MTDEKPPENLEPKSTVLLQADEKDIEENKIYAVLAYVGILFLIPLIAAKNSPYAKFHTNQGFILFLCWIGIAVIGWIPVVGWLIGFFGSIALLVFAVMGIINALKVKW